HWVVLTGKVGDDYQMWDPWQKQGAPETLVGRYGFGNKRPEEIIQKVIWHGTGDLPIAEDKPAVPTAPATPATPTAPAAPATPPAPAAPAQPAPGDDKPMAVKPTTEITLRRQPAVDPANVIKSVPVTAVLTVLDLPSQARAKIGKQGQWLRVREPGGGEGYVAAWFVQETAVPQTPPPTVPAPAAPAPAAKLTVKTTGDSVSFRSAPRVGDDTLIAYLPKNTQLQVIEAGAPANKIGVQGQWLNVQMADGRQGYVAAWFVAKA
ncbi:MAG TPA: SH3 domain-containing protein, partial [Chloroflexota bacterium]|nr:SH3 domain-containing protein [Chloroflexota bacterium]